MKKSLAEIRAEVAAVNEAAQRLCADLTEEQMAWRPQPGKWSIAENLVHLNVTTQLYVPHIQKALSQAREKGLTGSGTFELGMIGKFFVVDYLEPPFRMKSKAPKVIRPILQGPASDALPQFLRSQELFLKQVDAAEGMDLGRAVFVSPFSSLFRMKLIAAFAAIPAHNRRHLWIAGKIREKLKA
jgi:DinB family protein